MAAAAPLRDLQPVFTDRWRAVLARTDTDPLAGLVATVLEQGDAVVDRAVRRIVESVPSYGELGIAAGADQRASVGRNLEFMLLLLVERRAPTADELVARRDLGARRAQQGLPVTDLLRAFRVGYVVLWETLTETARRLGPETTHALLDHTGLVWVALDEISSAVAAAHHEVVAVKDLDARRQAVRLLAQLQAAPPDLEALEATARQLGLDPAGRFVVAVQEGHGSPGQRGAELLVIEQSDRTVLVAQVRGEGAEEERRLGRIACRPGQAAGIGMVRAGILGARLSLRDAEEAHRAAIALRQTTVLFREAWFDCLVLDAADRLTGLVDTAVPLLTEDHELARTVSAFLACDGKLSVAGEQLHVHPNTVAYRLQRLAERGGIDPRGYRGALLARTAVALAHARRNGSAAAWSGGV